ncbi:MAG: hypothetical protein E6R08_04065 [Nevskiaceae bacterium]|nr:MAG: hypothetical protein E6R08_04065 [Nevskiaceae bacterium]
MSQHPFKVGDSVEIEVDGKPATGTVETFRLSGDRQILTIIDEAGNRSTLVAGIAQDVEGRATVLVPPANIAAARTVALTMLAGGNTRLPVSMEASLLAAAVVALTGGAA